MSVSHRSRKQWLLSGLGMAAALTLTGCQSSIGGQTLPSPYWQTDDVQYFPAGAEFKLAREAAAMKAFKQEQIRGGQPLQPGAGPGPAPGAGGMGPAPGPGFGPAGAPGVGPGPAPGNGVDAQPGPDDEMPDDNGA